MIQLGVTVCTWLAAAAPAPPASASCASCHPAEYAEWRESRHSVSFTNGLFQSEWSQRRSAWCADCHAPLARDSSDISDGDPRAVDGIGCAACHVEKGRMVSTARSPNSPHNTRVDDEFGSDAFCQRCHEFDFPILGARGELLRYTDDPMQETVTQHRASGGRPDGCAVCHISSTPAGHAFPGSHKPEMVRRALAVESCRTRDELRLRLENVGATHAVPTGGVHRHIVLRAWRPAHPAKLFEARLGRRFSPRRGGGKRLVEDTTLRARAQREYRIDSLELGGDRADPVRIELRYVYAEHEAAELPGGERSSRVIESHSLIIDTLPTCRHERTR